MAGKVRRLNISEGVVVSSPTADSLVSDSLATFVDDTAFVTSKGSAAAEGDIYFNTTDKNVRFFNGTTWEAIPDDAAILPYTPTNVGDWADPDPSTVQEALDDVAEDFTDHLSETSTHGVTGDIVGTGGAQILTGKTHTDIIYGVETDSTSTGSNAALSAGTQITRRLTDAGLTSISSIAGSSEGKVHVLTNNTGNEVILNTSGFVSGNSVAHRLQDGASCTIQYDSGSSKWNVLSVNTPEALAINYDNSGTGYVNNTVQGALTEIDNDHSNHLSDTSAHGVTGNVLGTNDVQAVTNKDIDGGTASNTRRMTIPKDTKANLDTLTRKEGTVVYATDENVMYFDNGTTLVALSSGSVSTATPTVAGILTSFVPSIADSVRNTSSAYLITDTDGFNTFNITGNTYTITLPTLADNLGRTLTFKKRDNNGSEVTIAGEGAETIEGSGNYLMYSDNSVLIVRATSTGWVILYDYDEVIKSLDNQFTGGQVTLVRSGGLVNLFMNQAATHSSSDSRTSNTGLIPTKFRPIGGEAINLFNFSGSDIQRCRVTTTGAFALNYVDWAGGASNRTVTEGASLSYVIT